MNENKRITSPWIKIVKSVGAKALDEKCVETIQNQMMGVVFNTQNSQLVIWSLLTEKSFRHTAKIGLWQIFHFRFSSLATRNAISKGTEYVTFGFYFHVLVFSPFRKVWTSLSVSDTDFSVF